MKKKLEKRLKELKEEFKDGQKMQAEIETKRNELQQNMLRINGAIQVLNEILKSDKPEETDSEEMKQNEDS